MIKESASTGISTVASVISPQRILRYTTCESKTTEAFRLPAVMSQTLALVVALILQVFVPVNGFIVPVVHIARSKISMSGGKGFGGGEATRDPAPTYIDPNDPKGKQQAIHKAETFAEYLAKRGGVTSVPQPEPTPVDDAEFAIKSWHPAASEASAIPAAEPAASTSYAEYLAQREGSSQAPPPPTMRQPNTVTPRSASTPPAPSPAASTTYAEYLAQRDNSQAHAPVDASPVAPTQVTAPQPGTPELSLQERLELRRIQTEKEAAEDALLQPIYDGTRVQFTCPDQRWLDGRMGTVKCTDSATNKLYVWLGNPPTGMETGRDKPVIGLFRRSWLTPM